MILDFQQGIITYPSSGSVQRFLLYTNGCVNLVTTDGRIDVAFAHGNKNYLHTESTSINNAWVGIDPTKDAWLYWDIDTLTGTRTFGITYVAPIYGATQPTAPVADQHWFDTTNKKMWRYHSNKWLACIRVFACKINNGVFSPMGSMAGKPYAGTQVGLQYSSVPHGRIMVDDTGAPVRKADGTFITTEDEIFVNGSPVNTIRLEANVLNGTAVESIAKYQVVRFSAFGKVALASYNHIQTTAIAMAMEDLGQGQTGTLCMQGVITNPEWNWKTVGAPLWTHGSIPGLLVEYDPHVEEAGTYKIGKTPIARVLTPTSIFFDQGMGAKGDKGDQGAANVPLATDTVFGISKLSLAASDVTNPIVVGDNDPRNFNDRYPLPHNQAATTITTMPVGILTGSNMQEDLQLINDGFVKRTGDTMTGHLTLSADPANPLHAATKHYVDSMTLDGLADVNLTAPVADQVLKFNGTNWVNGTAEGGSLWQYSTKDTAYGDDKYVIEPKPVDAKTDKTIDQVLLPMHTEIDSQPVITVGKYWFTETSATKEVVVPGDVDAQPGEAYGLPARGLTYIRQLGTPDGNFDLLYTATSRNDRVLVETRIPRGVNASKLGGPTGWARSIDFCPFGEQQLINIVGTSIAAMPDGSGVFVYSSAYIGDAGYYSPVKHAVTALSRDLHTILWTRIIDINNTSYYDNNGTASSSANGIAVRAAAGATPNSVAIAFPVYVDNVYYAAVTEWGTMVISFNAATGATQWSETYFGARQPTHADSNVQGRFNPDIISITSNGVDGMNGYMISAGEVALFISHVDGGYIGGITFNTLDAKQGITITGLAYDTTIQRAYIATSGYDMGSNSAKNKVTSFDCYKGGFNSGAWSTEIMCADSFYDNDLDRNIAHPARIACDATGVYVINKLSYHGNGGYNVTTAGDITVMKFNTDGKLAWASDIVVSANRFIDTSVTPHLNTMDEGWTSYTHAVTNGGNIFFTAPLKYGVTP